MSAFCTATRLYIVWPRSLLWTGRLETWCPGCVTNSCVTWTSERNRMCFTRLLRSWSSLDDHYLTIFAIYQFPNTFFLIRRMVEIEQSNLSVIYWAVRPASVNSMTIFLCRSGIRSHAWSLACFPLRHDDVIKWKHFPRYWPFVREIHRSPVNFPHKGQWRGALMFTLICTRMNGWVNNREAGDLRRCRVHYDVIVMADSGVAGF